LCSDRLLLHVELQQSSMCIAVPFQQLRVPCCH
jgi:hypothetical protein